MLFYWGRQDRGITHFSYVGKVNQVIQALTNQQEEGIKLPSLVTPLVDFMDEKDLNHSSQESRIALFIYIEKVIDQKNTMTRNYNK